MIPILQTAKLGLRGVSFMPHNSFKWQGQDSNPGLTGSSCNVFTLPSLEGTWSSENHSKAVARYSTRSQGLGRSFHLAMDWSHGCEPGTARV